MASKLIRNISEEDYKVGYTNGVSAERERIIKLLEDNKGQKGLISVEYAQWLIKGENK